MRGGKPWKQVASSLRPKFEFQFHFCDTAHSEESLSPGFSPGPCTSSEHLFRGMKELPSNSCPGGKGSSWWAQVMTLAFASTDTYRMLVSGLALDCYPFCTVVSHSTAASGDFG